VRTLTLNCVHDLIFAREHLRLHLTLRARHNDFHFRPLRFSSLVDGASDHYIAAGRCRRSHPSLNRKSDKLPICSRHAQIQGESISSSCVALCPACVIVTNPFNISSWSCCALRHRPVTSTLQGRVSVVWTWPLRDEPRWNPPTGLFFGPLGTFHAGIVRRHI